MVTFKSKAKMVSFVEAFTQSLRKQAPDSVIVSEMTDSEEDFKLAPNRVNDHKYWQRVLDSIQMAEAVIDMMCISSDTNQFSSPAVVANNYSNENTLATAQSGGSWNIVLIQSNLDDLIEKVKYLEEKLNETNEKLNVVTEVAYNLSLEQDTSAVAEVDNEEHVIAADVDDEEKRFAPDEEAYTLDEFQNFYGNLDLWNDAVLASMGEVVCSPKSKPTTPMKKRRSPIGKKSKIQRALDV